MKVLSMLLSASFIIALLLTGNLGYALTGNEILSKVDETANAPKDRMATLKMVLLNKNGDKKERELTMWQKGNQKRLVRFLSPSDVKGVSFLSLTEEMKLLKMGIL